MPAPKRCTTLGGAAARVSRNRGAAAALHSDPVPARVRSQLRLRLALACQVFGPQRTGARDAHRLVAAGKLHAGHGDQAWPAAVSAEQGARVPRGALGRVPQALARARAVGGNVVGVVGVAAARALMAAGETKLALRRGDGWGLTGENLKGGERCGVSKWSNIIEQHMSGVSISNRPWRQSPMLAISVHYTG